MPYFTGLCLSVPIAALYILLPILASNPQSTRAEVWQALALAAGVAITLPLLFL